ncbi:hypothetical protein EXIGLDRAFT_493416 [Exidia glandulosa HHB12029]|uniref:Uncharacterized protein n=1 Tax=Exidia glandulosa HHB12029 TaxID=1314781 RepID=A0A166NB07_EXIGL|nr:hypothetical protein EXIGLDRAFT_493416 [Exidia glandulosa HHB12029]
MEADLGPPLRPSPDRNLVQNVHYYNRPAGTPWSQNGDFGFLEDILGQFIGKDSAEKVSSHAKMLFHDLVRLGLAQPIWQQIGKRGKTLFVNDIEQQFELVGYCDNHWKALLVGSLVYAQWNRRGGKIVKTLTGKPLSPMARLAADVAADAAAAATAGSVRNRATTTTTRSRPKSSKSNGKERAVVDSDLEGESELPTDAESTNGGMCRSIR